MVITTFLSRSPELLNRGPGGPASLGHVPHSSIFSPTAWGSEIQLLNRGTNHSGCWFSLPRLYSNWLNFLCTELYNNLTRTLLPASFTISHSIQPIHGQVYILIFLDRMHLLFTHVHFLFWQLGRVGGQYATNVSVGWIVSVDRPNSLTTLEREAYDDCQFSNFRFSFCSELDLILVHPEKYCLPCF